MQITTESVVLGEASPTLDNAGRPLVGVIVSILRDACHYKDFSLHDYDADPAHNSFRQRSSPSASRSDVVDDSPPEPQHNKESERTRVMFKPSLVARLGTIARKLLEAVDIIQKSSSAELGRHTEQWKIQWHVEAYMFISNRMEMQDTKTFHSLAACNR